MGFPEAFKSDGLKMHEAAQKGKYTRMASENPQGPEGGLRKAEVQHGDLTDRKVAKHKVHVFNR